MRLVVHACVNCDKEPKINGYCFHIGKCPHCGGQVKHYAVELPGDPKYYTPPEKAEEG